MQAWSGGSTPITIQIFSKLVYPKQTYCDYSNFQNGCCCHYLGFLKLQNFIGYLGGEGGLSAEQEQVKGVGWRGSRRISMSNFVKIGQSVANILRFFNF